MARSPTLQSDPPLTAEDTGVIALTETAHDQPPSSHYPSQRTLARWLLVILALYGVGWLMWSAGQALMPFVIGLVLAYLLLPLVNALARRMPRWLAILIVYLIGLLLLIGSINYIIPLVANQIQQLLDSTPSITTVQQTLQELLGQYRDRVPDAIQTPVEEGLRNALALAQSNVATYAQGIGTFIFNQIIQVLNTVTFLIGFLVIPIWLFYILNDADAGRALINRMLHTRIRPDFWNIWGIINRVFSDYIRGQLILGAAVGIMVAIGLVVLRILGFQMKYILLLSLLAGLTELIPIIGPIIGAIPGILIGLFISPTTGFAVLIVYVIVQQLENNLLVPRIIGESVGIHPAILTVVLIAMGQVFGLLGIILAAPLSAIARDLFIYCYRRLDGQPASEQPSEHTAAPQSQPIKRPTP